MTTGQLKGLFAEFLRLDRLTDYENTAKQCGNVLGGSVGQLEIRRNSLNQVIDGKLPLQNDQTVFTAQAKDLEKRREDLKQQAFTLANRIDDLKEISAQNAVQIQRKQDLLNSLERLRDDIGNEQTACSVDLSRLRTEYNELTAAIGLLDQTLNQRDAIMAASEKENVFTATIEGLTIEIDNLAKDGTAHQDAIHLMEDAYRDLQGDIHALNNDETLQGIKVEITEKEGKIKDQQQAIKDINNDFQAFGLESEIKALTEKTAILDMKDPDCKSTSCAFITNALEAADMLPALQKKLAACNVKRAEQKAVAGGKLDSLNEKLQSLNRKYTFREASLHEERRKVEGKIIEAEKAIKAEKMAFANRNATISVLRENLADAKVELDRQKALAAKLPQVQVAEERKADMEKRRREATEKGTALRSAFAAKEADAKQRIDETNKAIESINATIDLEAEEKLAAMQKEKSFLETDQIPGIDLEIQEAHDKLARLQGELARMEDAERELATVQDNKERINLEIADWTYLRNACSKNGLQALEIDGAAPLITSFANDLLAQAFGPLFTVRLRTQDDEGREVLDIVVIMEDGSEVLLENLSGGQRVWVLMALRLAMTLLSKEKSGRNFETAFFDELDGALDPENSLNFIAMYQSFMKSGNFKIIPFISHKTECRNMADHVLRFEAGKNPVWG